jgi:hypothetical protein
MTSGTTIPLTVLPDVGPHTFAQAARGSSTTGNVPPTTQSGTDGVTHEGVTCFHCHSLGHYANHRPSAVLLVQYARTLAQNVKSSIPSSWILLDSQSSISVFNNPYMISNIRNSPQPVCAKTNGGEQTSTHVGDFTNLGLVWYFPWHKCEWSVKLQWTQLWIMP